MENKNDPIAGLIFGGPCPAPRSSAEEALIAFFRPLGLAPVRARSGELIGFAPGLEMPPEPEKASPAPITPTGIDLTDVWLRLGWIGERVAEVRGSVLAAEQRQLEALRAMEQRLDKRLAQVRLEISEKNLTQAERARDEPGAVKPSQAYDRPAKAIHSPATDSVPQPRPILFPAGNGPDRV